MKTAYLKKTKPKDRLAIYKALGEMREKLAQELQVNRHNDAMAADLQRADGKIVTNDHLSNHAQHGNGVLNAYHKACIGTYDTGDIGHANRDPRNTPLRDQTSQAITDEYGHQPASPLSPCFRISQALP